MSYVSPNAPLPRNSADPVSPCEALKACQIANGVDEAAARGRSRINQLATPASFIPLGLPVVKQAVDAQARLAAANAPGSVAGSGSGGVATTAQARRLPAPQIVPLNVTPAEYSGCCVRGVDPIPEVRVQAPQVRISIPPAPIPTQTATGLIYLKPSASTPPYMPDVVTRRALPTFGGVLPVQPDFPAVGRYMGYGGRGLGAVWGNAGGRPCGATWGSVRPSGWVWLLVGAVGVYTLSKRG
jgi:hypothetical protein